MAMLATSVKGQNHVSLIHIDDLSNLYYIAAEKAPAGALLHASNDEPQTLKQIAELVAVAGGQPGQVKSWPIEEARKIYGPAVDGFVLDQKIDSKKDTRIIGLAIESAIACK